ncbi:MAG TPA: hypothetical protein VKT71_05940 [Candidatus Acidoferrales bacterium]|nr:hypothetical protein [Candidatus Acidoferrales bacterium]
MDRQTQSENDFRALCALCDASRTIEDRQKLLQTLSQHAFIEPEHQVVFESIRALFPRGPIALPQLRIHLNNRGFPDTDVEKYFPPERAADLERRPAAGRTP